MTQPIHIISLGVGVQSSTMAKMADHGEISPKPIAAIFSDTLAEPRSVYQYLEWLEGQLTFPVHRVTAGDLAASVTDMRRTRDGRLYSKTNVPFFTRSNADGSKGKIAHRSCTADYKIVPIVRKAREIVGEDLKAWRAKHRPELKQLAAYKRAARYARKHEQPMPKFPDEAWSTCQNDALVIQWIGISLDEVTRMKPSREPWIRNRWPLVELGLRRNDCLEWMKLNEYPEPPRSSCIFCPYHSDHEWRRLRDEEPEEFQKAVEFEIALQTAKAKSENFKTTPFLHSSLVALEAVDLTTAEERGQLNLFENECEGMCGL